MLLLEWEWLLPLVLALTITGQKLLPEPVVYPTHVVRSLVEEFTGDAFEFEEILPVFEDYVPDAKPADVTPETRALADLALLLFNSNEFVYVY